MKIFARDCGPLSSPRLRLCLTLAVFLGPPALPAGAQEPLTNFSGELRDAPPFAVGDEVLGSFTLDSAGARDLRTTPGALMLETAGGSLGAEAVRANEIRNVDPATGRPRRARAAGSCLRTYTPTELHRLASDLDRAGPTRAPECLPKGHSIVRSSEPGSPGVRSSSCGGVQEALSRCWRG